MTRWFLFSMKRFLSLSTANKRNFVFFYLLFHLRYMAPLINSFVDVVVVAVASFSVVFFYFVRRYHGIRWHRLPASLESWTLRHLRYVRNRKTVVSVPVPSPKKITTSAPSSVTGFSTGFYWVSTHRSRLIATWP